MENETLPWGILGLTITGVVCIGCLATIAIPNFIEMQNRAKRAEIPANIDGIKTAERGYDAAFDEFVPCALAPRAMQALDSEPVDWNDPEDFNRLGWAPDGQVRGSYQVIVTPPSDRSAYARAGADFTVHGYGDIDGDGRPSHYTATKSVNTLMVTDRDIF